MNERVTPKDYLIPQVAW